jgi:hypothetical protein
MGVPKRCALSTWHVNVHAFTIPVGHVDGGAIRSLLEVNETQMIQGAHQLAADFLARGRRQEKRGRSTKSDTSAKRSKCYPKVGAIAGKSNWAEDVIDFQPGDKTHRVLRNHGSGN